MSILRLEIANICVFIIVSILSVWTGGENVAEYFASLSENASV